MHAPDSQDTTPVLGSSTAGTRLEWSDTGYVGILGGDFEVIPILIDLQKFRSLDAGVAVAEIPKLDFVGKAECFEEDGYFVRVWARACMLVRLLPCCVFRFVSAAVARAAASARAGGLPWAWRVRGFRLDVIFAVEVCYRVVLRFISRIMMMSLRK